MIGKLLGALVSLLVYTCVATVIAAAILAGYYGRAWHLNREKLIQMLAIAQGVDLAALREQARGDREEPSMEQVSYGQILETRAVKTRNLELREQALRSGLQHLQVDQHQLAEEKKRLGGLREGFEGKLLAMQNGAVANGREDTRRTLETIKPKQAKELLVQMLDQKEMDEVVVLMSGMTDAKRAKIIAEFRSPSEVESLGEVLRRIRQGMPAASMAENTQKQIGP
jgi:hypothetical protein